MDRLLSRVEEPKEIDLDLLKSISETSFDPVIKQLSKNIGFTEISVTPETKFKSRMMGHEPDDLPADY